MSWNDAFQTNNPLEVEQYCRHAGIQYEWSAGKKHLRTRQIRPAVVRHPVTDVPLWFNQAHLFHVSSLPTVIRYPLLDTFETEALPRHAYYGDGSPIDDAELEVVRDQISAASVTFKWKIGDLLLLDNMLVSHGRSAYRGRREHLVAMADPMRQSLDGTHRCVPVVGSNCSDDVDVSKRKVNNMGVSKGE